MEPSTLIVLILIILIILSLLSSSSALGWYQYVYLPSQQVSSATPTMASTNPISTTSTPMTTSTTNNPTSTSSPTSTNSPASTNSPTTTTTYSPTTTYGPTTTTYGPTTTTYGPTTTTNSPTTTYGPTTTTTTYSPTTTTYSPTTTTYSPTTSSTTTSSIPITTTASILTTMSPTTTTSAPTRKYTWLSNKVVYDDAATNNIRIDNANDPQSCLAVCDSISGCNAIQFNGTSCLYKKTAFPAGYTGLGDMPSGWASNTGTYYIDNAKPSDYTSAVSAVAAASPSTTTASPTRKYTWYQNKVVYDDASTNNIRLDNANDPQSCLAVCDSISGCNAIQFNGTSCLYKKTAFPTGYTGLGDMPSGWAANTGTYVIAPVLARQILN